MTDVIDERLNKVLKEFNRMLGRPEEDEDILDRLIQFGLTINEAKGWLEKEPNYGKPVLCSYDDSYHDNENRRKVNRTSKRNINKSLGNDNMMLLPCEVIP